MYEFTDEMDEISGFGGGYEACCRAMLKAGCEWWDAHPDADPKFKGNKDVFGVILEANADAEALTKAIMDAPIKSEEGKETTAGKEATGAMHHAVIQHCMMIRKNGWDWYVDQMTNCKDDDET